MSDLRHFTFYSTPEHPCSYLDDKQATTLFLDPHVTVDKPTYSQLSQLGFRRSGMHFYRPMCKHCQACLPMRVPVDQFQPRRNHRRVMKANSDLHIVETVPALNAHYYDLYAHYIETRHYDGDMFPPSEEQFESFLINSQQESRFFELREGDKLLAVAVTDLLDDGLSAIYTFFDTAHAHRSLGVFSVLWQIEECQRRQLPFLYLGYWIKDSPKMAYKGQYRPMQVFCDGRWVQLN